MKTQSFHFELPPHLIAQRPSERRGDDRLMLLQGGKVTHYTMDDIAALLPRDTLLVFNNSRVRKARIYGTDTNGVRHEFLLVQKGRACEWEVLCKRQKRKRSGAVFTFPLGVEAEFSFSDNDNKAYLRFNRDIDDDYLDANGHIPLPPYIKRADDSEDAERYQNVYAREHGSAASPTAGLHWTEGALDKIREAGIETAFVTLHVGLGTFLPVRTETIEDHKMHEERYSIDARAALAINAALKERRPITAVGTTALRTLEAAFDGERVLEGERGTSIFIYPPYKFRVATNLFTNFHTPCSTLLMLVCALGGYDNIMNAYAEAVRCEYKFFSYGDAMLILM